MREKHNQVLFSHEIINVYILCIFIHENAITMYLSKSRWNFSIEMKIQAFRYELPRDKTNNVAVHPVKIDQPGHPSSPIRVFDVRSIGS